MLHDVPRDKRMACPGLIVSSLSVMCQWYWHILQSVTCADTTHPTFMSCPMTFRATAWPCFAPLSSEAVLSSATKEACRRVNYDHARGRSSSIDQRHGGGAIARRFATEGARVYATSRNAVADDGSATKQVFGEGSILSIIADVGSASRIERVLIEAQTESGRLDIVRIANRPATPRRKPQAPSR